MSETSARVERFGAMWVVLTAMVALVLIAYVAVPTAASDWSYAVLLLLVGVSTLAASWLVWGRPAVALALYATVSGLAVSAAVLFLLPPGGWGLILPWAPWAGGLSIGAGSLGLLAVAIKSKRAVGVIWRQLVAALIGLAYAGIGVCWLLWASRANWFDYPPDLLTAPIVFLFVMSPLFSLAASMVLAFSFAASDDRARVAGTHQHRVELN